jgi:hypothetical protein
VEKKNSTSKLEVISNKADSCNNQLCNHINLSHTLSVIVLLYLSITTVTNEKDPTRVEYILNITHYEMEFTFSNVMAVVFRTYDNVIE